MDPSGRLDLIDVDGLDWASNPEPTSADLQETIEADRGRADQFLRTAVLSALADGHVSGEELVQLQQWADLFGLSDMVLEGVHPHRIGQSPLDGIRTWLDQLNPEDPHVASFIVSLIPAQCPFERDIVLFGQKIVHIPPMCKLNPLYEQLVGLRFRCLNSLPAEQQLKIAERDAARALP